jgi:hypothetical protein
MNKRRLGSRLHPLSSDFSETSRISARQGRLKAKVMNERPQNEAGIFTTKITKNAKLGCPSSAVLIRRDGGGRP